MKAAKSKAKRNTHVAGEHINASRESVGDRQDNCGESSGVAPQAIYGDLGKVGRNAVASTGDIDYDDYDDGDDDDYDDDDYDDYGDDGFLTNGGSVYEVWEEDLEDEEVYDDNEDAMLENMLARLSLRLMFEREEHARMRAVRQDIRDGSGTSGREAEGRGAEDENHVGNESENCREAVEDAIGNLLSVVRYRSARKEGDEGRGLSRCQITAERGDEHLRTLLLAKLMDRVDTREAARRLKSNNTGSGCANNMTNHGTICGKNRQDTGWTCDSVTADGTTSSSRHFDTPAPTATPMAILRHLENVEVLSQSFESQGQIIRIKTVRCDEHGQIGQHYVLWKDIEHCFPKLVRIQDGDRYVPLLRNDRLYR